MHKKETKPMNWRLICLLILICSCEQEGDFSPIDDGSDIEVLSIDTLTLEISTVYLDSIITQNSGSVLIGNTFSEELGHLSSTGYMQFVPGSTILPDDEDTYDSLGLTIYPYRNTFGKGSQQKFSIYRVKQDYEPADDFFYQFDKLEVFPAPIGNFTLDLNEDDNDSIYISLDDALGLELFKEAQQSGSFFEDNDDFLDFFKGIAIIPDDASIPFASSIPFNSLNIRLELFYTRDQEEFTQEETIRFDLNPQATHFHHIDTDRQNTTLKNIETLGELSSRNANNKSFLQASSALVTRIRIPYLHKIEEAFPKFFIAFSSLIIEPVANSFDSDEPLPESLSLYYLNKFDNLNAALTQGAFLPASVGILEYDQEFEENTNYEIDLTGIIPQLMQEPKEDDVSFYITLPNNLIASSTQRLEINTNPRKTKLNLIITLYDE